MNKYCKISSCYLKRGITCSVNTGVFTSVHWIICPSLQDFGPLSSVQAESKYERRMQSVFNLVLEEVESLSRKHPPVSYLVTYKSSCWSGSCRNLYFLFINNNTARARYVHCCWEPLSPSVSL